MFSNLLTKLKIELAAYLGLMILTPLAWSLRWSIKYHGFDISHLPENRNYIVCFWHGRQLMMPWVYHKGIRPKIDRDCYVLISQHTDGRIIARLISFLKLRTVTGSSSRGGSQALMQLIAIVQGGQSIAITPDGPRGPRYKSKTGALRVAQSTGVPIIPLAFAASKRWTFSSWDAMILPKPFSRVQALLGRPIFVKPGEDLELKALELDRALCKLTLDADLELGSEIDPILTAQLADANGVYEANA